MKDYAKKVFPEAYNDGFHSIVAETLAQPIPKYKDYFSNWENVLGTHAALNKIGFYQVRNRVKITINQPNVMCNLQMSGGKFFYVLFKILRT